MAGYYEDIYIENLFKNSGFDKQLKAIKELGKLKSTRAVTKLKEISTNSNADIILRVNSVLALAEIGDRTFIKSFIPLNEILDIDLTEVIILAIGKLKAVEYIDELESFLNNGNKEIKSLILETLDKINDEKAVKTIIKFYNDSDIEIKELVKFYLQNSSTFMEVSKNMSDNEILNILTLIPKERAFVLIKKLIETTENKSILKIIIKALGEIDVADNIGLLKIIFNKETDKILKLMTIESMEKLNSLEKKEFLIEILKADDRDIKTRALMSLGSFSSDSDITSYIKKIITSENEWWMTKKIAVLIFSKSSESNKSEFIANSLKVEKDLRVAKTLIQELGELNGNQYSSVIRNFLKATDIDVQKAAMSALAKLGDKEILEFLLNNEEAREHLMPESLKALLNFNDLRIIKILIDVLKKRKAEDIMLNIALDGISLIKDSETLNLLIDILNNKEYKRELRAKAIMMLAAYKELKVEAVIKKILEDKDEWWLIKKLALIICRETEIYSLINIVIEYAADLDDRLNRTARETAIYFYENYYLKKFNDKQTDLYKIAVEYLKLF